MKRIVEIELPRPRTSEIVSSEAFGRYVAQIWGDLREEASRGMRDDEDRSAAQRGARRMTRGRARTRSRAAPAVLGFGSLVVAILAVEVLIRVGVINRFIVPLPSQIAAGASRASSTRRTSPSASG